MTFFGLERMLFAESALSASSISTDEIGGIAAVVSAGSNAYLEEGGESSAIEELLFDMGDECEDAIGENDELLLI